MRKKIGEILMESGLISKSVLDNALLHQEKNGGNITQYLIAHEHIKEEDLAKCLSIQFGYPYLPLRAYDIPDYIVKLVPAHIAQKYLLMPVDKIEHIITIVMSNPLDEDAITEVENITRCKVQPFVGVISDIAQAIDKYYKLQTDYADSKSDKTKAPLFIVKTDYTGVERRRSIRIKAALDIHFPLQDTYKKAKTKNVSMHGLLFESANILPIGSYLTIGITLPEELSAYPLVGIAQVVRAVQLDNGKFDIGVKLIDMAKENIEKIIRYASTLAKPKNTK